MFWLLLLGFFLLVFTLVIYLAYQGAGYLRYRAAIRTWLVVFYTEPVLLFFLPRHVYLPGLPTLYKAGGADYLLAFTTELDKLLPNSSNGRSASS